MKLPLFVSVFGLALMLVGDVPVRAEEVLSRAQPVVSVSGATSAFFALPGSVKPMTPLVRKVGHYCRHSCQGCRNDCYGRFRVYCRGPSCRQKFVLCMRHCWNTICRRC